MDQPVDVRGIFEPELILERPVLFMGMGGVKNEYQRLMIIEMSSS